MWFQNNNKKKAGFRPAIFFIVILIFHDKQPVKVVETVAVILDRGPNNLKRLLTVVDSFDNRIPFLSADIFLS